ncbi:MAG: glycosyltransferase [Sphingobacteriales bacterium]|nr:MAG: glycosyltransferase [Sphingobacteriales bacterium]
MQVVAIICMVLMSVYAALMLLYRMGWERQPGFRLNSNYQPKTKISVVIPARNEAERIGDCISSILKQNYPMALLEVIVVDDHSDDNTEQMVNGFRNKQVRCISLATWLKEKEGIVAYKKEAIAAGIANSNGELIVTTDADCTMEKNWLRQLAGKYEVYKPVMIVAPVDFNVDQSFLDVFQSLDFMTMQGITAATHELKMGNMCNGANLAFTRAAYDAVGGYKGIDHMASGDDYLLMMKMQKEFPGRIGYLKSQEAMVHTPPQPDLKGFLQQRIRWASKSGKYDDKVMTLVLSFVYLFNLSLFALAICCFFSYMAILLSGAMLLIKIFAEMIFLFPVARFFGKQKQLVYFPFLQPFHIAYIVVAGFMGFIGVYKWKGRTVK